MKLAFFGGSEFSVYVLNELKALGILPELIITTPDKPKGRKLILTPTPTKIWANENNIEFIDPVSLKNPAKNPNNFSAQEFLESKNFDLFLVASYGKIIPRDIFDIPKHKTLNIHPSILPKYRGASPIQSQILNNEKDVGVTIMQIDEGMDTGPIVAQRIINLNEQQFQNCLASLTEASTRNFLARKYPCNSETVAKENLLQPSRKQLQKVLATEGAKLFAEIVSDWILGKIAPQIQNESEATLCQKVSKADGELQIDLKNLPSGKEALDDLLKIKAFEEWPTTYFYTERNGQKIRVIITDATLDENSNLKVLKVIPEGKREMLFEDFLRGLR